MSKKISILFFITLVAIDTLVASTAFAASIGSRVVSVKNQKRQEVQMTLREIALRVIPQRPLDLAFAYFDRYSHDRRFSNQDYLTIIDFRIHSSRSRMFILNLRTGEVEAEPVAHGRGSDPDYDGMLNTFSNVAESRASSMGFFRVSETYRGEHGYSVRLDGLSQGLNEKARSRAIVIHGASYVTSSRNKIGRSWGCPAVDSSRSADIIDKLKGGSILFIYGTQFETYLENLTGKK